MCFVPVCVRFLHHRIETSVAHIGEEAIDGAYVGMWLFKTIKGYISIIRNSK